MANKNAKIEWKKEMVDEAFSMDIGKCIEIDLNALFDVDGKMNMSGRVCRIGEDELQSDIKITDEDGEVTSLSSKYRRNQNMK